MSILLITGTSTGVGKTVVTAAIAALARDRGSSVAVVKPAQTGVGTDEPGDLAEIGRLAAGIHAAEYARYPDPLSPEAACAQAGADPLRLDAVAGRITALAREHQLVLVEGAGGLLVRFADDGWTLASLARVLGAPVLVVAAAGLGTLNHTALTLEVLAGRGVRPAGIVIGSWPKDPGLAERTNVHGLEQLSGRPLAGALPSGAPDVVDFVSVARHGLSPALGGSFDAADFRKSAASAPPGRIRP
ncbi:MAG: dethiobiotin synthetase [Verrucomicrobiota bacterium]